ncbi:MAG TPA: hypothetical protein VJ746_08905, partial [Nitrospira sp.]|nr:hypothetical protein [Nitrospira sp.]
MRPKVKERSGKPARRSAASLRDRLLAERETPWRRAAGLILLTGILSLVSSFSAVDETARVAGVAGAMVTSPAAIIGSTVMEQHESAGTVDHPIGMTIGIARLPDTEEESFHRAAVAA